ncbi:1,4-alpha-glucan branching enzyme [Endozoicomonas sp. (ex Bugula neritina AB1)]|nr:1,4-alpha-glucan branching enzyme [Endozoicomonas sp. (ex Bugula neritina AB1)]
MNIATVPPHALDLEAGLCACPFDILGIHPHPDGKGLVVRAWRPDAKALSVVESPSGKKLGDMKIIGHGLFELHLPRRRKAFSYELEVCWENNHTFRIFDPYEFGQYVLREDGLDYNRLYRHLGALPLSHAFNTRRKIGGVLFKVYAPNARSVKVVGSFNGWDERLHPMASADDGIWRLFIPGLQAGDHYKYLIHDEYRQQLPLKSDPFSHHIEQWPGLASVVQEVQSFPWKDSEWMNSRHQIKTGEQPMSIYEVHAGSWKHNDQGELLNYRQLAHKLVPYVKEMGFTHIELLPVPEHPLIESWGYQPVGMFAPTSRFGSPDDFRYFVDQCHKAGIGVLLDWVPAHFPEDGHGLAKFDGTALFEHPDPSRGWHPDWKTCIYDFGKPWVQDFLISNALYWLDEYHIDGLRVDAVASMLYLDYSRNDGEWEPNIHGGNENLEAVAFLKKFNETVGREFPDVITIAEESTSWPGVSRPVYDGGLGFDFKWNMGWMNDSLEYMKKEPIHRSYHHRDITFSTVYAWSERFVLPLSHDEVVHGKGTLLTRMPGDEWQKFANLRAYLSFMFAHPGKKLLFMGAELGTDLEWNEKGTLDWSLLENPQGLNAGIQRLVKVLNHLYMSVPALHELDLSDRGFSWTVGDDSDQSVLVFRRYDKAGNCTVIASNMTPVVRYDYCVGVPEAGHYKTLLNSDDKVYGGSGVPISERLETINGHVHGEEQYLSLTLPPLATVILQKKSDEELIDNRER